MTRDQANNALLQKYLTSGTPGLGDYVVRTAILNAAFRNPGIAVTSVTITGGMTYNSGFSVTASTSDVASCVWTVV